MKWLWLLINWLSNW